MSTHEQLEHLQTDQIFTSNDLQFALDPATDYDETGFFLTCRNFLAQVCMRIMVAEEIAK